MIIDVDKIPKGGLKVSRDFEFPSLELVEESAIFLKPVRADLAIRKMGEEVWIKGRVTARLRFVCSRCLSAFEFPVDSRFDLVFLPEELHELKEELDEEDLDQLFYRDHQIDIREVVLEQLNLTFPAKPLCSESCEGICAVCGRIRRGQPLRLHGPRARRAARGAQNLYERQEINAESKTKTLPFPERQTPGARRPGRPVLLRLLQLRDAQAPPQGLPRMRPLPRPPGHQATES